MIFPGVYSQEYDEADKILVIDHFQGSRWICFESIPFALVPVRRKALWYGHSESC